MLKHPDLKSHKHRVKVIGNVVVAWYSDLTPSQARRQRECLG